MRALLLSAFLALGVMVAVCATAFAGYVSMQKTTWKTAISAKAIDTTKYTGWLLVSKERSLALEIDYTNNAGTAVAMKCETHDSAATANGAGAELHIIEDSATSGTSNSIQHTWSNAVAGNELWTWTVDNLPHDLINCEFLGTGADANDKVTVRWRAISP